MNLEPAILMKIREVMAYLEGSDDIAVSGNEELLVRDMGSQGILGKILNELRIMNIHLGSMTDERINTGDTNDY